MTSATGERHSRSTPDGTAERVDLPITGMTCAACANRIEKSLRRSPGVRRAGVNFATSRATVEYDPAATGVRQLIATVKDVGYGTAGTARADFVVDDSARPSGSAQPLEKHLASQQGVIEATFNLGTMQVRVEYLRARQTLPPSARRSRSSATRSARHLPNRKTVRARARRQRPDARSTTESGAGSGLPRSSRFRCS